MTVSLFIAENILKMCVFKGQNIMIILTASSRASLNDIDSPHPPTRAWPWRIQWLLEQFDAIVLIHVQVPAVLPITAFPIISVSQSCNENSFDFQDSLKGLKNCLGSAVHTLESLIQTHKSHIRKRNTASESQLQRWHYYSCFKIQGEKEYHRIFTFSFSGMTWSGKFLSHPC